MVFRNLFLGLSAIVFLAIPAFAQETTSAIRGTVVSSTGNAIPGASVSVIHEPSGSVSSQVTNSEGIFLARNLRVGGPYSIIVTSPRGNSTRDNLFLELGETDKIKFVVGASVEEEVVVVGQKLNTSGLITGPKSTLTSDQIGKIEQQILNQLSKELGAELRA